MIIVAAGGWIYWIVVSKFTLASEIGHATIVINLVATISVLTQLGLEYPLLKKSSENRSKILGTALAIELSITVISIPIFVFLMNSVYGKSFQEFDLMAAVIMLVLVQIGFVLRSFLFGISNVKKVLFADIFGTGARFTVGYVLVINGFGSFGLILSFLIQYLVVVVAMFVITKKTFDLKLGNFQYVKEVIRDGLINTPAKLARLFIISLCIVLLGAFGINTSAVGVFYITLMISMMAGGFASSIAYMSIPVSSASKTDLSSNSLRIGLSLTAPLIVALTTAPKQILELIGSEYSSAAMILVILSISILPYSIVMNTISKFNNLHRSRELIILGSIQICSFLVAFWFLVPLYGTLGGAFAFLIGFTISAIPSMFWLEKFLSKYVLVSIIAIVAGWLAGYVMNSIIGIPIVYVVFVSITITSVLVISLKNITVSEIMQLLREIIKR